MAIQKVKDLDVYNLSFDAAMKVFKLTTSFPREEKYSLIDQIRRSSRSVSVNISEGFGKRAYPANFKKYLIDSLGSLEETKSWIEFSLACEYIDTETFESLIKLYEEIGAKIYRLHDSWR